MTISATGQSPPSPPGLIPQPVRLNLESGRFVVTPDTTVIAEEGLEHAARYLAERLAPALGGPLPMTGFGQARPPSPIILRLNRSQAEVNPEAYDLIVTGKRVFIRGGSPAGVFNAVQTLLQLLPPEVFANSPPKGLELVLPAVTIHDVPRFAWRGLMLDSARHFLQVEEIKKFLDVMALHKFNVLHWHLTEDQAWRIEIKQYPRLTEIGSVRAESPQPGNRNQGDGTPYGPYFYTQEEVREIVAYAASRSITVVPEIELPGHSRAALAAYPELGCTGGPYEVRTKWGVESDIYCAGKDASFTFLEHVLTEVMELFPSPYIHVGGDEAPKHRWENCERCQARIQAEGLKDEHELQSYFIQRMERFLNAQGRRLIGWDEILEGGLAPNASVMSWRGEQGGITAAKSGHDVVMSPTSHCYFDYAQSRDPGEPEAIGGLVPLRKVYSYDPVPPVLTEDEGRHILGVQGNLWSEYLFDASVVEYFGFPRACALAEVAWTPREQMDYADFHARLDHHLKRLDGLEVNYRKLTPEPPPPIGHWLPGQTSEEFTILAWEFEPREEAAGTYQIRFQYTGGAHRLDIEWCEITRDGERVAIDEHLGITGGTHQNPVYSLSLEAPVPGATYHLRANVRSDGGTDSRGDVMVETFTAN